jgi:23S rRNA (pseudouridine1915-N3)-methyltransferase
MKIQILAIGTGMPLWVQMGVEEYMKRFPSQVSIVFQEIPQKKFNSKISPEKIQAYETELILSQIPKGNYVIALDRLGKIRDTQTLAEKITAYQNESRKLTFLIGGPEGFSRSIMQNPIKHGIHELWSLSPLTFPHPLVRIILIEQLYRAFSILSSHPYHR